MISAVEDARSALAGKTIAAVSERALSLAEGALQAMSVTKLKIGMVLVLAAGVALAGAGTLAHHALGVKPPEAKPGGTPGPAAKGAGGPKAGRQEQARTDRYGDPLPAGAVARLGSARLRADGAVQCLAFTPDGKALVSGHDNHSMYVTPLGK